MKFTKDEKDTLKSLRRNNPKRDIPNDEVVKNALSKMKRDRSEVVIDDLIIRNWDDIIEMEMI